MLQPAVSLELSAYELRRLENIRRNQDMLGQLGLINNSSSATASSAAQLGKPKRTKPKKKAKPALPTRRSSRSRRHTEVYTDLGDDETTTTTGSTASAAEGPAESDDESDDDGVLPQHPHQLTPLEAFVFRRLKAWRTAKANELQSESYRIAQNRTLCELVRTVPIPTTDLQLLSVWGLADVKVAKYGEDILKILSNSRSALALNTFIRIAVSKIKSAQRQTKQKRKRDSEAAVQPPTAIAQPYEDPEATAAR
jgi:superfamily II DNA helicase RecQ